MYKTDFHVHSKFSFDGKDYLEDICQEAIYKNLAEICFTEHFDVDPKDVSYGVLNYKKYYDTIEKCKVKYEGKIKIRCGLEIGEPHLSAYISDLKTELKSMNLDFIIGSVHNLNSVKLRLTMPNKEKNQIYEDYFKEILQMVKTADIDIIGHLDLMKRYAFSEYGNYDFYYFKDLLQQILQVAVERKIGIEINTSGYRNAVKEAFPKLEILQLYKKLGGEIITIGSDSHSCRDVFSYCEKAYDLLRKAGFLYFYTFNQRKAIKHSL